MEDRGFSTLRSTTSKSVTWYPLGTHPSDHSWFVKVRFFGTHVRSQPAVLGLKQDLGRLRFLVLLAYCTHFVSTWGVGRGVLAEEEKIDNTGSTDVDN
jgi:hypothetical protein